VTPLAERLGRRLGGAARAVGAEGRVIRRPQEKLDIEAFSRAGLLAKSMGAFWKRSSRNAARASGEVLGHFGTRADVRRRAGFARIRAALSDDQPSSSCGATIVESCPQSPAASERGKRLDEGAARLSRAWSDFHRPGARSRLQPPLPGRRQRLVRVHDLRAADALQLAAARAASDDSPETLPS